MNEIIIPTSLDGHSVTNIEVRVFSGLTLTKKLYYKA